MEGLSSAQSRAPCQNAGPSVVGSVSEALGSTEEVIGTPTLEDEQSHASREQHHATDSMKRSTQILLDLNAPPDLEEGEIPPVSKPCDPSPFSTPCLPIAQGTSLSLASPGNHLCIDATIPSLAFPNPCMYAAPLSFDADTRTSTIDITLTQHIPFLPINMPSPPPTKPPQHSAIHNLLYPTSSPSCQPTVPPTMPTQPPCQPFAYTIQPLLIEHASSNLPCPGPLPSSTVHNSPFLDLSLFHHQQMQPLPNSHITTQIPISLPRPDSVVQPGDRLPVVPLCLPRQVAPVREASLPKRKGGSAAEGGVGKKQKISSSRPAAVPRS